MNARSRSLDTTVVMHKGKLQIDEGRTMDLDCVIPQSHNMNVSSSMLGKRKLSISASSMHLQSEKTTASSSACVPDSSTSVEPSMRWILRLMHRIPDSLILGAKKLKVGDHPSARKISTTFGKVSNCSESDLNLTNGVSREQILNEVTTLPNVQEPSCISAKCMKSWIQRWCVNHSQVHHYRVIKLPTKLDEPAKTVVGIGDLNGRRYPSVEAMARMRPAIEKSRPYESERKGPFVIVWNIEEAKA